MFFLCHFFCHSKNTSPHGFFGYLLALPSNSHHQDSSIFCRESQPKPVNLGPGVDRRYLKVAKSRQETIRCQSYSPKGPRSFSGCWLNRPSWKICSSKWTLRQIAVKIKHNWNHRLEWFQASTLLIKLDIPTSSDHRHQPPPIQILTVQQRASTLGSCWVNLVSRPYDQGPWGGYCTLGGVGWLISHSRQIPSYHPSWCLRIWRVHSFSYTILRSHHGNPQPSLLGAILLIFPWVFAGSVLVVGIFESMIFPFRFPPQNRVHCSDVPGS